MLKCATDLYVFSLSVLPVYILHPCLKTLARIRSLHIFGVEISLTKISGYFIHREILSSLVPLSLHVSENTQDPCSSLCPASLTKQETNHSVWISVLLCS